MEDSILKSTKKMLGLDPTYTVFDLDIITHINAVFTVLAQLGIGPVNGYMITDDTADWADYLDDDINLNSVRSYMFLKVRMLFDPPATSFAIAAMEKQLEEMEYRINLHREATQWANPILPPTSLNPDDPDVEWWLIDENEPFPVEAEVGDLGFDPATGDLWRRTS